MTDEIDKLQNLLNNEINKSKKELDDDEIQTLRYRLNLKPKEILISPVTNEYLRYNQLLIISGFYKYDYGFDEYLFIVPNHAFRFLCSIGDLFLAKKLLYLGDVSLEHCHELCFRRACDNGHLEIAQWLYSLRYIGPDILETRIIKCVYNKELSIVKWLWFFVSKTRQNNILKSLRRNDCRDIAKWLKSFNKPLVFKTYS